MKEVFIYEAEYISQVNGEHFFNVDLGFRTWTCIPFIVENPQKLIVDKIKPRDNLLIKTKVIEKIRSKPHKYSCSILKKR